MAFLLVGILLWAFYQQPGKNAPFAFYIVHELPPGLRGVLIAGIFSTAMGSLSTALNALATSFTEDWYRSYLRKNASQAQIIRAARWSTVVFSVLLILIGSATAYAKIVLNARIIPIVLGIFGYTYGSLLGVFLVGLLTKRRGNEGGNLFAMVCGFSSSPCLAVFTRSLDSPPSANCRRCSSRALGACLVAEDRVPLANCLWRRRHFRRGRLFQNTRISSPAAKRYVDRQSRMVA